MRCKSATAPATVRRTDAQRYHWKEFREGEQTGRCQVRRPADLLCNHFRWESKMQTNITVCLFVMFLCFLPVVDVIPAFFACKNFILCFSVPE